MARRAIQLAEQEPAAVCSIGLAIGREALEAGHNRMSVLLLRGNLRYGPIVARLAHEHDRKRDQEQNDKDTDRVSHPNVRHEMH